MTFVDHITTSTDRWQPRIVRDNDPHELTICWPRSTGATRAKLAAACDLDDDLFSVRSHCIYLHIPAEMAGGPA